MAETSMLMKKSFFNPTKGFLSFEEMKEEILVYMKEEGEYSIIIGCDSSSSLSPHFPVAVVVLRKGKGGRFFLKKVSYSSRRFHNTRERVMEEVFLSCKLAMEVKDALGFSDILYIHADVGGEGGTKDMIKEVTNFIRGNGFEPKIKPESFAASHLADRYT